MNWNDLESAWKRQTPVSPGSADLTQLRETVEAKSRKLARRLFVRDLIEASAGLLVAFVFSHSLWTHGLAYWPDAVAIAIVLAVTGFFVRERIRAHRHRVGTAAPLLMKVDADVAELEHQQRLLLNAGKWYVAPLMLAVVIVLATIVGNNLQHLSSVRAQLFLAGYVAFCGLLAWQITAMNHRAARTKIAPRIAELRKLRDDIISTS